MALEALGLSKCTIYNPALFSWVGVRPDVRRLLDAERAGGRPGTGNRRHGRETPGLLLWSFFLEQSFLVNLFVHHTVSLSEIEL